MTETGVVDQIIRFDRDATATVYRTLEHGFAEKCSCIFRKNFAAQPDLVYPESFRALLDEPGIDPNKEAEAFEYGPVEENFNAPAFRAAPRLTLEFTTHLKWLLGDLPTPTTI